MRVKITPAQIIALRSATLTDAGTYELTTAKAQTLNALTRVGVVVEGSTYLTVQGVSVMHSVSHIDVIASKGHTVSLSDDAESLVMFVLPPRVEDDGSDMIISDSAAELSTMITETLSGVIITGDEPNTWEPDFTVSSARECYFGCGVAPVAVFVDYVGRTEGVCAAHRVQVEGKTYDIPADAYAPVQEVSPTLAMVRAIQGGEVPTACVIQNTPGMAGVSHYHSPACADVKREMRKWGQSESDVMFATFATVADILVFEDGGRGSDYAEEFTPEWWSVVMENSTSDVRIMPCLSIPAGRVGDSPLVTQGNFFRTGFDQPSPEKVAEAQAEIDAHNFNTCDEKECITCAFKLYEACKGNHTGDNVCAACDAFENARVIPATVEDDTDAGFVETLVTKEYELSVIVDEITGTRVSLGWVTLTMNAAQSHDWDRVAEEYGRTQNTRTPRHGWASIITVHDVADI